MTGMTSKMGIINRGEDTMLVPIFCAESLKRISEVIKFCWAFAIA